MENISLIVPDDLDQIAELASACFASPWTREGFMDALSGSTYCIKYTERLPDHDDLVQDPCSDIKSNGIKDIVKGFCIIYYAADQAEVADIAVLPDSRKCGIGSALLQKAIEWAGENNMTAIFLEVRQSNQAAIGLYEKYGFSRIGTRKNYYKNPVENAIVMERKAVEN